MKTLLFEVESEVEEPFSPFVDYVRARSPREAARIVRGAIRETHGFDILGCVVQLMREPKGGETGLVYKPAGLEVGFSVVSGRLRAVTAAGSGMSITKSKGGFVRGPNKRRTRKRDDAAAGARIGALRSRVL